MPSLFIYLKTKLILYRRMLIVKYSDKAYKIQNTLNYFGKKQIFTNFSDLS